jgi:hypothetical protein
MWVVPDKPADSVYVFADAFVSPVTPIPLSASVPDIGGPWVDVVPGLVVVTTDGVGLATTGSSSPVASSVNVGISDGVASMDFQFRALVDGHYVTLFFPYTTFTKGFYFGLHADGTCPWSYTADDGYNVTGTASWAPDLKSHEVNTNFNGTEFVVTLDGIEIFSLPTLGHACTQTGLAISMNIATAYEIVVLGIVATTPL